MSKSHTRPWHRTAVFGDGPQVPLDRERRAVWKARLKIHRRTRALTPLFEDIGLALIRKLGLNGRLDPSHETLAAAVGCSIRSVQRALEAMRACGLVTWVQRLVRAGWRVEQTSNAYLLMLGSAPACGRQKARETVPIDISVSYYSPALHPQANPAACGVALKLAAARMEERLLAKWQTRHGPIRL